MGVYVKSMEMPKNCRECPMEKFFNWKDIRCEITNKVLVTNVDDVVPADSRPNWCPLVEISVPHGHLIDVNTLNISEYEFTDDAGNTAINLGKLLEVYNKVKSAKAIIEKECVENK